MTSVQSLIKSEDSALDWNSKSNSQSTCWQIRSTMLQQEQSKRERERKKANKCQKQYIVFLSYAFGRYVRFTVLIVMLVTKKCNVMFLSVLPYKIMALGDIAPISKTTSAKICGLAALETRSNASRNTWKPEPDIFPSMISKSGWDVAMSLLQQQALVESQHPWPIATLQGLAKFLRRVESHGALVWRFWGRNWSWIAFCSISSGNVHEKPSKQICI